MTFVKTKIELSKLSEGDILEVLLAEGEPLERSPQREGAGLQRAVSRTRGRYDT